MGWVGSGLIRVDMKDGYHPLYRSRSHPLSALSSGSCEASWIVELMQSLGLGTIQSFGTGLPWPSVSCAQAWPVPHHVWSELQICLFGINVSQESVISWGGLHRSCRERS